MARAARYVDVDAYAVTIGTTRVARFAAWGSLAGTVRQHASDRHYEPTIHSGINTGFDMASITDGARRVARQTDPAWADVSWFSGTVPHCWIIRSEF